MIARGPVMRRLRGMRHVDDFFITRPLQEAAVDLVSTPAWDRHLRGLSTRLRERCALLAAAVARELPAWTPARVPEGGLHLWVHLPPGLEDTALADAARTGGVAVWRSTRAPPSSRPRRRAPT